MFSDQAAEVRLLGAILDDPELVLRIKPILFSGDRVLVYDQMKACFLKYGVITYEGIESVSGRSISSEYEAARGAAAAPIVDRLVLYAKRRELAKIQDSINRLIVQNDLPDLELHKVLAMPAITAESDTTLSVGASEFIADLNRKRNGTYTFVDPCLAFLKYMLGGEWPRQGLTVILGEGGAGKTTLVGNSALNMARAGLPSLTISLEMTKARLVSRLVANMADINNLDLRSGSVPEQDLPRIDAALAELSTLPLYIDDRQGLDIHAIVDQIRIHKELHGIQAVFLDYLQIIDSTRTHENTSELYATYAQLLRNAGVKYDVAVIVLSQQNRAGDGLASILGSGRVGHIADVVLELKRAQDGIGDTRPIIVDVHKNRDGPLGSQTAVLNGKFLRFAS